MIITQVCLLLAIFMIMYMANYLTFTTMFLKYPPVFSSIQHNIVMIIIKYIYYSFICMYINPSPISLV